MIADNKLAAIQGILSNETYTRDSALMQQLEAQLNRLSSDTLRSLNLIVSLKCQQAAVRAVETAADSILFDEMTPNIILTPVAK